MAKWGVPKLQNRSSFADRKEAPSFLFFSTPRDFFNRPTSGSQIGESVWVFFVMKYIFFRLKSI